MLTTRKQLITHLFWGPCLCPKHFGTVIVQMTYGGVAVQNYDLRTLATFPFRVVLCRAYRGLTGGFLLLRNFSVAISVSPHVCFVLVLILISMFLR